MTEYLELLYMEYYEACDKEQHERANELLNKIMDIEYGKLD